MRLITPENDHGPLAGAVPGALPSVSVVIPVYNRTDLLVRTLAGLAGQRGMATLDLEVIVIDDGSTEDVRAAIHGAALPLTATLLRQERNGYGAGRARNLGASRANGEVVLFLDADCLPDPELVISHAALHAHADNLVVIGERRYADTSKASLEDLVGGIVAVDEIIDTADWRSRLYRRTLDLAHGSEAYRAFLSGNVSMRRASFASSGGFDERFKSWGGEDTELGWRLFNAGSVFVPTSAVIYHQVQHDEGTPGWREEGRSRNEELLVDRIPHRFYRKDTSVRHLVPKVSVVVTPAAGSRTSELIEQLERQRLGDWEVFFPLDTVEHPRVSQLPDTAGTKEQRVTRAIAAARGEYVAILSGHAAPGPRFLDRLTDRLDDVPRASIARSAFHGAEATTADALWGGFDLPAAALVRRREWAKVLSTEVEIKTAWRQVQDLSWDLEVAEELVTVAGAGPAPDSISPHLSVGTAAESARTGGFLRRSLYRLASVVRRRPSGRKSKPVVRHLGNSASREATVTALPWASVVDGARPSGLVVGEGVVLDDDVVQALRLIDSPRMERVIAGASIGLAAGMTTADFVATCATVELATEEDVQRLHDLAPNVAATALGADGDRGEIQAFAALTQELAP